MLPPVVTGLPSFARYHIGGYFRIRSSEGELLKALATASNPLLDLGKSKIRPPTVSSPKSTILGSRIRDPQCLCGSTNFRYFPTPADAAGELKAIFLSFPEFVVRSCATANELQWIGMRDVVARSCLHVDVHFNVQRPIFGCLFAVTCRANQFALSYFAYW